MVSTMTGPSPTAASSDRMRARHAPVAQLDRVPGYEPGGREFESLRARQCKEKGPLSQGPFFFASSKLVTFELTRRSRAEFDEAREARRRTSLRSGDGPERSEGFAAGGREQSLRARQIIKGTCDA